MHLKHHSRTHLPHILNAAALDTPVTQTGYTYCAYRIHLLCIQDTPCCAYRIHLLCVQDTLVVRTGYTCCAYRIHLLCVQDTPVVRTGCYTNKKYLLCVHDTPSCHTYRISSKIWEWATSKAIFCFCDTFVPLLVQKCEDVYSNCWFLDFDQCIINFSVWRKFTKVYVLLCTKH